jgi:hypothetical protein
MTAGSMAVQLLRREKHQVVEALRQEGLRVAQAVMPPLMTQAMTNAGVTLQQTTLHDADVRKQGSLKGPIWV